MSQPKVKFAFSNVSMALGHDGLAIIAKKFGVKMETLTNGECILFINRQRDKLKLIDGTGVVMGYIRIPKGRVLPVEAIQYVAQAFSRSGKLDVDKAVKSYVIDKLKKRANAGASVESSQ